MASAGCMITSLDYLPFSKPIEFYIFIIGNEAAWEGGIEQAINRNFEAVAKNIGPKAIIVKGLDKGFSEDVCKRYLGPQWRNLKTKLPALLVTDKHPDKLSEKSMRLLIPLKAIGRNYETIHEFLNSLALFVRGESNELLKTIENPKTTFDHLNEIIIAQPTLMGFGLNLNAAFKRYHSWWKSK